MKRYIAGGIFLIPLFLFVIRLGWGMIEEAKEKSDTASEAVVILDGRVDLVDARQERVEDLYEQQIQMNERLYDLQLHDRGMIAPRSQPTQGWPGTPIPER